MQLNILKSKCDIITDTYTAGKVPAGKVPQKPLNQRREGKKLKSHTMYGIPTEYRTGSTEVAGQRSHRLVTLASLYTVA